MAVTATPRKVQFECEYPPTEVAGYKVLITPGGVTVLGEGDPSRPSGTWKVAVQVADD
ncbi:hypothetical protein [Streptomyces sp. NPDC003077]|uniref:hypothetical protein n=1 Tax=Streptomyces sp. NPDC003077 TaxID=3154443 RepID=UPI0033B8B0CB